MNISAQRSFRRTLLVLVWSAVAVPLFVLVVFQIRSDYQRQMSALERDLTYETERISLLLTQHLLQLMGDLDRIATDGSVIRSLSMPILSPISVEKIETYLGDNPSVESVMLIDKEFFPIEVVPTWALTDDTAVYEPFMAEVVSSPQSVTEPRTRMFIPPKKNGRAQQLVFIRPILTASSSLSQPFQVDGLLLINVSIEKLISGAVPKPEAHALIRLLVKDQALFDVQNSRAKKVLVKRSPIILGLDNQSLAIEAGRLSDDLFAQVLLSYRTQAMVVMVFVLGMMVVTKRLASKLVRPLHLLTELTATISNNGFRQRVITPVDVSAMQYREFSQAFQLLGDMEALIGRQIRQLHEANATLEQKVARRTEELEANVQLLSRQRQSLQLLVQYSLEVHELDSQDDLAQKSIALATHISQQPCGLFLTRTDFFPGFEHFSELNSNLQSILRQHYLQLNDFRLLPELMRSASELHCFPIGSSVSSYQGLFLTARSPSSEQAAEALMVLTTMVASAVRQLNLTTKLQQLAHSDALTRLPNRHFFNERFNARLDRFNLVDHPKHFGVFVIDVNGLKFVNDHYGHQYGDEMLIRVAEALRETARSNDVVARVGGDEFYILIENVTSDVCESFAVRLGEVSTSLRMTIEHNIIELSFSFGYACTDQDSLKNLVMLADERMYFAKKKHYTRMAEADS